MAYASSAPATRLVGAEHEVVGVVVLRGLEVVDVATSLAPPAPGRPSIVSIQPLSTNATCLISPPMLRVLTVGVARACSSVKAVGDDPERVSLLGEVGEEALALVGDRGYESWHGELLCRSSAGRFHRL